MISEKDKKELPEERKKWIKLAEFMNFGVYDMQEIFGSDFKKVPIFTKEEVDLEKEGFMDEIKKLWVDWEPTENYEQAHECESELLKKTKYVTKVVRYKDSEVEVNYSYDSTHPHCENIHATGKNELEAICNACIEFQNRYLNSKQ